MSRQTGLGAFLFSDTPWWLPLGLGLAGGFAAAAAGHWALKNTEQIAKTSAKYAPLLLAENPVRKRRRR